MKVEMLDGGWFTSPANIWRRGDEERPVRLPVPVYVIDAGDERILVDTGLAPAAVADPVAQYRAEVLGLFTLEQERPLAEQLDLRTVTKVVLTHLHFDHAGGIAQIPPGVPVVLQRREWEAANDRDAIARNAYLPKDYSALDGDVVLVDGDHDLLGDGSVRLLATPGHTPGHQSVLVADAVVLGGDVVHYASTLDDERFPLVGDDHAAQAVSAGRLRALRDAGVGIRPGHDPAVLAAGPVPLPTRAP